MLTTLEKVKSVLAGIALAVVLSFLFKFLASIADMPDVHVSWSTGDCVRVLNYAENDRYSCDNMPIRYRHVWVL